MVRSKATSAARLTRGRGRLRGGRAGPSRPPRGVQARPRASGSPTCRSSPGPSSTPSREFPHVNATVGDGRAGRPPLRQPRHRRRPRLRGPAGPGHPRRRRQAPAGHRPGDQRPGHPGPHEAAVGRRHRRAARSRSPTPGRSARFITVAGHQPAPGRHPVDRRRDAASRSSSTLPDGSEAIAIHPVGILALSLGPPRLRRRLRRRLPARGQDDPRDPRLGGRALT